MKAVLGWLSGKKTYLIAVATILVAGLHTVGYVTDSGYNAALALLGAGGLAALRAGVTKSKS